MDRIGIRQFLHALVVSISFLMFAAGQSHAAAAGAAADNPLDQLEIAVVRA
jgi:type IV secretory pathway VirB2 component (pilin)